MPEYLEIFDVHNVSLQKNKLRRQVHEEGDWHRTAQVYVVNSEQELLCNLRSPEKDVFPLLWDLSIGGHLMPQESYESCAARELQEELGLETAEVSLHYLGIISIDGIDEVNHLTDREHAAIFLYNTTMPARAFAFQPEEIVELRYFSISFLRENLLSANPEIPVIPLIDKFLEILSRIEKNL
ncbi:NUDIX domain-containing protein [Rhodocytophaga rosea]|uniref:NUDIX domain-containing protein n=1 Tax=Rhodocytophaga rosea TaxID=2704465 RepID=A0A6C0GS88_9BACT|nr:NUDIX domain-containing protein [Rhodocytophaga rosea]QHT70948.1 NUDIX domain-containing protein [Rhodocytophaga rosea]